MRIRLRGGRTWISGGGAPASRPDPVLIAALRAAHGMLEHDQQGLPSLEAAPPSSYRSRLLRLAFLAPDIQRAILEGRQPQGLTLKRLMAMELPVDWDAQAPMIDRMAVR